MTAPQFRRGLLHRRLDWLSENFDRKRINKARKKRHSVMVCCAVFGYRFDDSVL